MICLQVYSDIKNLINMPWIVVSTSSNSKVFLVKSLLSGLYLDSGIPLFGYIGSPWLSVFRSSVLLCMLEISLNLTSLIETCFLPTQMVWQFFFFYFFVSQSISCSMSAISWLISILCIWIASWSILTVIINKLATLQIKKLPKPNNLQAFYCEIKWQNSGRGFTKLIGLLIRIIDKMDFICKIGWSWPIKILQL